MATTVASVAALVPRMRAMSAGREERAALTIRERLVSTAIEFTVKRGWSKLTMSALADKVGVSRQTVYNELGSKRQLAEAMVMEELGVFLHHVDGAFVDNPDDLVAAIEEAARRALQMARTSPLLHAVLSTSQGAESDLLPLLTTHSAPVLGVAGDMIRAHVTHYDIDLADERVESLIDLVVRLVISYVMQPDGTPEETAADIGWIAARVLRPATVSR